MKRKDRRDALRLVMAAAVAPTLCATRLSAATPDRLIAPPSNPMRYSRTLARDLVDGRQVIVTRDFDVTFRRFAGGFMVPEKKGADLVLVVAGQVDPAEVAEVAQRTLAEAAFPGSLSTGSISASRCV